MLKKKGNIDLKGRVEKMIQVKTRAMQAIGNNSVNFFKVTNFNAQSFVDTIPNKWAPLKKPVGPPGRKANGQFSANRKILVNTGAGRQSIRLVEYTPFTAVVRAEAHYMQYHNEGTKHLPKRQFMGDSQVLAKQNETILRRHLKKLMG